jgi:hypothetical protein
MAICTSKQVQQKTNKILYAGIAIMTLGAVGTPLAIILELQTGEPACYLMMRVTASLFGIGGTILGWGIAKRRGRSEN